MFLGFCRLARIYGWTHREILQLTLCQFNAYYHHANITLAEEQLQALRLADWPNTKPSHRQKIWDNCQKLTNPHYFEERQARNEDIFKRFERTRQAVKKKHNNEKGKH